MGTNMETNIQLCFATISHKKFNNGDIFILIFFTDTRIIVRKWFDQNMIDENTKTYATSQLCIFDVMEVSYESTHISKHQLGLQNLKIDMNI